MTASPNLDPSYPALLLRASSFALHHGFGCRPAFRRGMLTADFGLPAAGASSLQGRLHEPDRLAGWFEFPTRRLREILRVARREVGWLCAHSNACCSFIVNPSIVLAESAATATGRREIRRRVSRLRYRSNAVR
jgi:hypothetical protein